MLSRYSSMLDRLERLAMEGVHDLGFSGLIRGAGADNQRVLRRHRLDDMV